MQPQFKTLPVVTVATAGTAVQLSATAIQAFSVLISADSGNTGKVYIGDSTVDSTNGEPLAPGDSIMFDAPQNRGNSQPLLLSDIYADTATNGNKVRVQYIGWA